jgi:hypothetical protein
MVELFCVLYTRLSNLRQISRDPAEIDSYLVGIDDDYQFNKALCLSSTDRRFGILLSWKTRLRCRARCRLFLVPWHTLPYYASGF